MATKPVWPHPKKWDRTGQVLEQLPHDQYLVRIHGSGRIVQRNRRHLRHVIALQNDARREPAIVPSYSANDPAPTAVVTVPHVGTRDGTTTPSPLVEAPSQSMVAMAPAPNTNRPEETLTVAIPPPTPQSCHVPELDAAMDNPPTQPPPSPQQTGPGEPDNPSPIPNRTTRPRRSDAGTLPKKLKDFEVTVPIYIPVLEVIPNS